MYAAPVVNTQLTLRGKMYEYMILTQKDRVFGGKFNPEMIQVALNNLATEGWRVVECATTTFPGLMGAREEMVFVLERQK